MSYKYINPGYAELSAQPGPSTKTDGRMAAFSPNHVAFSGWMSFIIPSDSRKVWMMLSTESPMSTFFRLQAPLKSQNHNSTLIEWSSADRGDTAQHSIIDGKNVNGGVQGYFGNVRDGIFINKVVDRKYNRIMMMLDCEIGAVECWINGESVYRQEGLQALMEISNLKDYWVFAHSDGDGAANVIISDEELLPNEDVLILGSAGIEADVEPDSNGVYKFTEEGQKYLQQPDVSKLTDADVITGITAIARPAYTDAEGFQHVDIISSDESGTITTHGVKNLTSLPSAGISGSWALKTTKAELAKMKVGMAVKK